MITCNSVQKNIKKKIKIKKKKKNPPRSSLGEKYTTTFCKLPTPGMCVYMYIVFVGGCKHVCVYVCTCVCVCVCICACLQVCVYVCVYVLCAYLCVCVCPYEAYPHGKFYMQILQGSECHEVEHLQMPF